MELVVRNGSVEGRWIGPAQKPARVLGTIAPDGSVRLDVETWTKTGDPSKATLTGRSVDGAITAAGQWSTGGSLTGEWNRRP